MQPFTFEQTVKGQKFFWSGIENEHSGIIFVKLPFDVSPSMQTKALAHDLNRINARKGNSKVCITTENIPIFNAQVANSHKGSLLKTGDLVYVNPKESVRIMDRDLTDQQRKEVKKREFMTLFTMLISMYQDAF